MPRLRFRLSVNDHNNKHRILLEDDEAASSSTPADSDVDVDDDQDLSTWIPVEGLYGVYKLPSGHVYVWIVNSECVYQAPSLPQQDDEDEDDKKQQLQPPPWWQIRRVTELHLTRVVPRMDDNDSNNHESPVPPRMTRAQRLEETRQLALLRQALKHHEWYFCGHSGGGDNNDHTEMRIPDMTWNLQTCFLRQEEQQQSERIIHEDDEPTIRNNDTAYSAGSSLPSHRQPHDAADSLPPRGGAIFDVGRIRRRRRWWDSIKSSSDEAAEEEEESSSSSSSSVNGTTANQDGIRNQTVAEDAGDEEKMDDDNGKQRQQEEIDTVALADDSSVENTKATNVTSLVAAEENDDARDEECGSNVTKTRRWWERSSATDGAEGARGRRPDSRFFWNEAAVEPLVEIFQHSDDDDELRTPVSVLLEHAIPVTSAFCGVQSNLSAATSPSDQEAAAVRYDQLLITRRGRFRAGTRFTKRGADSTGAVANYAETEQVLFLWKPSTDNNDDDDDDGSSSSDNRVLHSIACHVQTRGSIPLRWSSPTDIKTYRPRIRIGTDPLAQARAVRQHLVDQASRYIILPPSSLAAAAANETTSPTLGRKHPALLFLNLIDKKSDQGRLGRALDAVLKAVLDVYNSDEDSGLPWLKHSLIEHMWFDFHAEVKSGRWDKLVGLLERVKPTLEEQDYCRVVPDSTNTETAFRLERLQTGVVRTNCMDCLDRTNVVQSLFGRYMMFQQLSDDALAGISAPARISFRHSPMTLPWTTGEVAHRLLWADNADAISRLYAGTPALKGDFTRTGKRTKKGALDDGMNSLQRYYLNNFLDADRQEGMDLLTGYQPFSNIDGDDDSIGDSLMDNDESLPTWSRLRGQGMSVQEAARRMLLGIDSSTDDNDDDSGRDHVRIKVRNRNGRRRGRSLEDGEFGRRPRSLDLRWLPGDLQTQVRSLVSSPGKPRQQEDESFASEYLHAMDERSASDVPWWVAADSSASEADDQDRSSRAIHEVASASNNVGYLLGAFVAGTQKPLAMAAVVVGLVAVSFTMTVQIQKEAQPLQDDE